MSSLSAQPVVALTEGFQSAFLVGAAFALAGALLAARLISGRESREAAQAQPVPVPA